MDPLPSIPRIDANSRAAGEIVLSIDQRTQSLGEIVGWNEALMG
jgi:hypothetical protein